MYAHTIDINVIVYVDVCCMCMFVNFCFMEVFFYVVMFVLVVVELLNRQECMKGGQWTGLSSARTPRPHSCKGKVGRWTQTSP